MTRSQTMSPGTTTSDQPSLREVARHVVLPSGIMSSGWRGVEARCAEFGDEFDEWQRGAGKAILAKRADGMYAATVGGVTISIPRQVVKTFLVGRIVFALCTLFPGMRVLWTAHHGATIDETFRKLKALALSPRVRRFMADDPTRDSHGEQEIRFANGSVIRFGARGQGFALGFDKVDIVVFDEAQRLIERALDDIVATTAQAQHPHGALVFYMGTPPRPTDPGEVFRARRAAALQVERERADGNDVEFDGLYIETSADPDCDPDDRAQWAKGNPSFRLGRTPLSSMLRLRAQLVSVAAWMREGLGVWDDEAEGRAISAAKWEKLSVDEKPAEGTRALGVAFSLDGLRLSLAGGVVPLEIVPRKHRPSCEDKTCEGCGPVAHVELLDAYEGSMELGLDPLAEWMAARWRDYARFVLSGRAGAAVLAEKLRKLRVPERRILVANTPTYLAACAGFLDEVNAGTVTHLRHEGQTALDMAVAVTDRRSRSRFDDAWSWWSADGSHVHVEAVSLALYGARKFRAPKKPDEGAEKRRGVIL